MSVFLDVYDNENNLSDKMFGIKMDYSGWIIQVKMLGFVKQENLS